jgi:large subunit ribosomal protein L7/L12
MPNVKLDRIADELTGLSHDECGELVGKMETAWGVKAQSAVLQLEQGVGQAPVVEQTEFAVVITAIKGPRVVVIKEVRDVTKVGLKEAKDLVESLPYEVRTGCPKEEAEGLRDRLVKAGAEVELR